MAWWLPWLRLASEGVLGPVWWLVAWVSVASVPWEPLGRCYGPMMRSGGMARKLASCAGAALGPPKGFKGNWWERNFESWIFAVMGLRI